MRHDGEVTAGRRSQLLNACPRAIDARVKRRPRLAVRRRVVRREEVDPEVGVGCPTDVAEVPLLEQRIEGERDPGDVVKACGGGHGAGGGGTKPSALPRPVSTTGIPENAARRMRRVRTAEVSRP